MKEKAFVSLVVYVHNAELSIQDYVLRMDAFLQDQFEKYEIILVNDASTDQTLNKIESIRSQLRGLVSVVTLAWRHRPELAMLAGTDLAIGDFVYEIETTWMDYPLEILMDLFKKSGEGFDIVSACPSKKTSFSSRLFYRFFNKRSSIPLELKPERVRIISRRALNRILFSKEKIRYRKAFFKLSGFAFADLYYEPNQNIKQIKTERGLEDKIDTAFEILLVYTDFGIHFCFYIALFFLLLSLGVGTYAAIIFVTLKTVAAGWTTLMLVLSTGFSGIFMVLGILSKYVSFIMTEVKERPLYVVSSINRLSNTVQKIC